MICSLLNVYLYTEFEEDESEDELYEAGVKVFGDENEDDEGEDKGDEDYDGVNDDDEDLGAEMNDKIAELKMSGALMMDEDDEKNGGTCM